MLEITKEFTFEAGHYLDDVNKSLEENKLIFGKCNNWHGHSYRLFCTVTSKKRKLENGMIMNFSKLKEIVNARIIDDLDHHTLNEVSWLNNELPTCENMLLKISNRLKKFLPNDIKLTKLKLYETEKSYGTWTED